MKSYRKYVWVYEYPSELVTSVRLYRTKEKFKFGDKAYFNDKTGYVQKRKTKERVGFVVKVGRNLNTVGVCVLCERFRKMVVDSMFTDKPLLYT